MFNSTIKDLTSNRTSRKYTSETVVSDASQSDYIVPVSSVPIPNHKPKYLFYRTPSNKDNKKIEFSSNFKEEQSEKI